MTEEYTTSMLFTERKDVAGALLAAGAADAIGLSQAGTETGGGKQPPALTGPDAQLSLEQSRGVIFLSAAYLADASLTMGSRIDRSAL